MVKNLNERDDSRIDTTAIIVDSYIYEMWEAGASLSDIEDTISHAIESATGEAVLVSIGDDR